MPDVITAKTQHIDIMDFLDNGIIREASFREKIAAIDWAGQYRDAKVIIKGCDRVPIPTWAYMMLAAYLAPHAKRIFWGEPCSAVPVYVRED
ncbi:MAG TPA: DUF2480 family protein [Calditrichia bacterium]|nr:DUF2480 family protein [Calditrichota bacterium]HQU72357.1 DUF2480 family protein [Calditrichia bacterium]HQV31160.1 DUF2480 family protein [Calditrichia bacterium]